MLALARTLADGKVSLDPGGDREETRRRLLALPGIGPWTASYIAMRALRDRDAFLPTDHGVRRALELLGQDGRPAEAARLGERWRPYRAYAVQHLWARLAKTYTLVGRDGRPYESATPGTLGGHRRGKGYGRLDCPAALRWIAKGHYVKHRVFFADEATAIAAGYRPCAVCLPERYREWKANALKS
jgi:metal binding Ada-like protein